jgi:hypothetical protein
MPQKIHGAATASQNLSADLSYYTCFVSSPGCWSDPNPNPPQAQELLRLINIQVTGNPKYY